MKTQTSNIIWRGAIPGIVRIDSEKALIAVTPTHGFILYRDIPQNAEVCTETITLEAAIEMSFGERCNWITNEQIRQPTHESVDWKNVDM